MGKVIQRSEKIRYIYIGQFKEIDLAKSGKKILTKLKKAELFISDLILVSNNVRLGQGARLS